jgi:peptide/nickel transport system ATP-binding protein/oligopeptide transport system ATP-binding protein
MAEVSIESAPPVATSMTDDFISVENLSISFPTVRRGWVEVVRDASFSVGRGQVLGLVGESGSGKTVTSLAMLGLIERQGGRITGGRIVFDGQDLTNYKERDWRTIRGRRIGMIFQQPIRSLDPAFTIGDQIAEGVREHFGVSRKEAWRRAVDLLDRVHIPQPEVRARAYPHMCSGGMCQRVMLAIALACEPEVLLADEPTTALDVTVQARLLELLREIQEDTGITIVYVSHDLAVVSALCDKVTVMYAGETVETASIADLFRTPRHPYTEGLLRSIPHMGSGNRLLGIPGRVPPPQDMPEGCRFNPRCGYRVEGLCTDHHPELIEVGPAHVTRCVRAEELQLSGVSR